MTADLYDLGMRLRAAADRRPAPRIAAAPVMPAAAPVAVRAARDGTRVTASAAIPGQPARRAEGPAVLAMLAALGAVITAGRHPSLITDDDATLPALLALATAGTGTGDPAAAAACIGWWASRADFPGASAVIPLTRACRERWVTGLAPPAEASPATWRAWLRIPGTGCPAMLAMLDRVQAGTPLSYLNTIEDDTTASWEHARAAWDAGTDWREPDTVAQRSAGLRARCDAADLYAAALLRDPLYRRRAVHSGHVAAGTVTIPDPADPKSRTILITCDRPDSRIRETDDITFWAGTLDARPAKTRRGTVTAAEITAGTLTLTAECSGRTRPDPGTRIVLHAADPVPSAMKNSRARAARLYRPASWLASGGQPAHARRDVPLGVMIAGAD